MILCTLYILCILSRYTEEALRSLFQPQLKLETKNLPARKINVRQEANT